MLACCLLSFPWSRWWGENHSGLRIKVRRGALPAVHSVCGYLPTPCERGTMPEPSTAYFPDWPLMVLRRSFATRTTRLILLVMAYYANADGLVLADILTIASGANVTPPTVRTEAERLVQMGELRDSREGRYRQGDWRIVQLAARS